MDSVVIGSVPIYIKVLKLYLPLVYYNVNLLSISVLCVSELESGAERAHHIQQIVVTLSRTVIIVMRYLFAFLNQ